MIRGRTILQQSLAAYREALGAYRRERYPLDWAMVHNFGAALRSLAMRETGSERLEEAVKAYRQALLEYTPKRVPLDWAMTQNNLAAALQRLGERGHGTAQLEEAVAGYNDALAVFMHTSAIHYLEICWENRDRAVALIAERRGEPVAAN